ncbi:hypothetical protein ACFFJB_05365 [Camelimonas abortus]|uniref:hypothetical protein n=1 Tax=Camelimonas abortus TaxID=1017184 RepID=UPI0035EBC1DD
MPPRRSDPCGASRGACRDASGGACAAPASPPAPAALAAARRRFENGDATLKQLAAELGLSPRRLGALARRDGWTKPARPPARRRAGARPPAGRAALVARLWAAAARQMDEIEAALASAPGEGQVREREARLMAMLVRVAAGLAAIERAGAAPAAGRETQAHDGDAAFPDDADAFRRTLESRIDALLRRRPAGDLPG